MQKRSIWSLHHKPFMYMVASRHEGISYRFAFITCKYNKDNGLKKEVEKNNGDWLMGAVVIGYQEQ